MDNTLFNKSSGNVYYMDGSCFNWICYRKEPTNFIFPKSQMQQEFGTRANLGCIPRFSECTDPVRLEHTFVIFLLSVCLWFTATAQPFTNFTSPFWMIPTFLFLLVALDKTSKVDVWSGTATCFLGSIFSLAVFLVLGWQFSVKNIQKVETGIKIWARHLEFQNSKQGVECIKKTQRRRRNSGRCIRCLYQVTSHKIWYNAYTDSRV